MITVYGLKACDTCRKALRWLEAAGMQARLHDLRADGLDEAMLSDWLETLGWEALLNRRSTTWRSLSAEERDPLDEARAKSLMLAHPTLVKRPVFDIGGIYRVGFDDAARAALSKG
jgi:Spx/MgsR family transcriptional regulator